MADEDEQNYTDTSDLSEEVVEAWLDRNEEFVASYYSRKASKYLLDAFMRPTKKPPSRTSSPLPFHHIDRNELGGSARNISQLATSTSSGCSTPKRKSSLDPFLRPMLSHYDGIPSFIRFERSLSRPRQRKSKEELKELRVMDEQALLMELAKDIANDLEITSLCHKILQNVSILTDGDRCSLFLVQEYGSNGQKFLVSKVYDVNADSSVEEMGEKEEIIVPWGMGIVGYAAEHGETINIPDAYAVREFVFVFSIAYTSGPEIGVYI